jgi:hypothetical protein
VAAPSRRGTWPSSAARALGLASALALVLVPRPCPAEPGLFADPLDGAFDLSRFLASRYGFAPLVVPITEPALGYGAAGGLLFVHGRLAPEEDEPSTRRIRPSLSAALGMATSNGSWAAGAGHLGHWREGSIRYLGAAAYASLELTAYPAATAPLRFRIDAAPLVQELTFTIPGSDLAAGARYVFAATRVEVSGDAAGAGVTERELDALLSGIGPVLRWDGRDSIFSPSRGTRVEASASWFGPWLGSDLEFWRARIAQVSYAPIAPWLVGALRLDLQFSGGDPPFWARPYVSLRGVPALRYQGEHVFVVETEERIDFTPRWSAVVFGGAGLAASSPRLTWAWNAGGGSRYLLARRFGLRVGLDVARGPEEWAFYVIFGNGWN